MEPFLIPVGEGNVQCRSLAGEVSIILLIPDKNYVPGPPPEFFGRGELAWLERMGKVY
jgi:hypothetical protein